MSNTQRQSLSCATTAQGHPMLGAVLILAWAIVFSSQSRGTQPETTKTTKTTKATKSVQNSRNSRASSIQNQGTARTARTKRTPTATSANSNSSGSLTLDSKPSATSSASSNSSDSSFGNSSSMNSNLNTGNNRTLGESSSGIRLDRNANGSSMGSTTGPTTGSNGPKGANVQSRFTLGAFVSMERFADPTLESQSNDSEILSGRAFVKVEDWGDGRWEFVSDLRDKNDFFDKMDNDRLHLTASNDFQVRQLSLRKPNLQTFWAYEMGRFPIPEAGSVFVDGLDLENHWSPALRSGIFAGLNPKKTAQSYLQGDPKAQVYGAHLTYESKTAGWNKNLYVTHALARETYSGATDRQFLYHNAIYQWNPESRIISLAYLDFVPNTYIQTADLVWQQGINARFSSEVDILHVDAIEYVRRQSVLSVLPASPYQEESFLINYRPSLYTRYYLKQIIGNRVVDSKSKNETDLGWLGSNIFSNHWDSYAMIGQRTNFTSRGPHFRLGLGYFSNKWESNLDLDYATENNDDGTVLHPFVTEFSISNYYSKWTFFTLSFERAVNENVTIFSTFFKVGLRFGNREISPVRDGAPPRGAL